jgi:membrane protease YdiL (CAAX protease family)
MADYDTQYTTIPEPVPPPPLGVQSRARWPLASAMALDLIIIIVAVLLLTTLVTGIFVGVRAASQHIPLIQLRSMGQAQLLRLMGVDGIFAALLIQNAIFVATPMLRVAAFRREPLAEIGFQARSLGRLALFGLGLGVLVLIGNATLGYLFSRAGIEQNQADQYPLFKGDYLGQAAFFVGAAVLAPVGEEVLFRGYVFNAIRRTFQFRAWGLPAAYLVSALLFMAAHALAATQGLIGLLIPTFLMGLLLAWGMHRTGSLIPGIIAHALNNSVGLITLILYINNPGSFPKP